MNTPSPSGPMCKASKSQAPSANMATKVSRATRSEAAPILPVELLQHIASYCVDKKHMHDSKPTPDYKTLGRLCQSSKHLAACFTTYLYRRIAICPDSSLTKLVRVLASYPQVGKHIRELDIARDIVCSLHIPTELEVAKEWAEERYSPEFVNYMMAVVSSFPRAAESAVALLLVLTPNVRRLTWQRMMEHSPVMKLFRYAVADTRVLSKLEDLSYNHYKHIPHTVQAPILLLPALKTLTISNLFSTSDPEPVPARKPKTRCARCYLLRPAPSKPTTTHRLPNLDRLTMEHSLVTPGYLSMILSNAPALESLALTDMDFSAIDDHFTPFHGLLNASSLGDILRKHTKHNLTTLEITQISNIKAMNPELFPSTFASTFSTPSTASDDDDNNGDDNDDDDDNDNRPRDFGQLGDLHPLQSLQHLKIDPEILVGSAVFSEGTTAELARSITSLLPGSLKTIQLDVSKHVISREEEEEEEEEEKEDVYDETQEEESRGEQFGEEEEEEGAKGAKGGLFRQIEMMMGNGVSVGKV